MEDQVSTVLLHFFESMLQKNNRPAMVADKF